MHNLFVIIYNYFQIMLLRSVVQVLADLASFPLNIMGRSMTAAQLRVCLQMCAREGSNHQNQLDKDLFENSVLLVMTLWKNQMSSFS